jgi:sulfite exporter TauE/SafE
MMIGFGLGTSPALIALSMAAGSQTFGIRAHLRRLTPVLLAVTAIILLVRGFAPAAGSASTDHAHSVVMRP